MPPTKRYEYLSPEFYLHLPELLLQFLLFSLPKIAEQEEKYETYVPYTDTVTMDIKCQETGTFVRLIISETIQQGQLQNKSHHYDH